MSKSLEVVLKMKIETVEIALDWVEKLKSSRQCIKDLEAGSGFWIRLSEGSLTVEKDEFSPLRQVILEEFQRQEDLALEALAKLGLEIE